MLGYWKNELATAEVIDSQSWFHTGDKARIVNDHIYITGRIKDILVLANGEKVPPIDMETAILDDPLFEQCIVIGEGKPFLSAIIVMNDEQWPNFAASLGLDANDENSLSNQTLLDACQARITRSLNDFPGYAQIHMLTLTLEPWTVENDKLTPTLKMRRAPILQHYKAAIDRMYAGH